MREVWIMMDILLPLPQLMLLQLAESLLGIGERLLEMVSYVGLHSLMHVCFLTNEREDDCKNKKLIIESW